MGLSTIYLATNTITNKKYVGFTGTSLNQRKNSHKCSINRGIKTKFYDAIRSYGWDKFKWEVLYQSWDKDHCLKVIEPKLIEEFDTLQHGYNMTTGGEGTFGKAPWNKGKKGVQVPWNKGLKIEFKPKSEDHKNSLRLSKLGKKHEIVKCHHCSKEGGVANMTRYHFDNCKMKEIR